ncbi:MAG: hypothetical protein ACOYU3_06265 [Bacillota bacterium]
MAKKEKSLMRQLIEERGIKDIAGVGRRTKATPHRSQAREKVVKHEYE